MNSFDPQAALKANRDAVSRLRRCCRCILPASMPFIAFSDDGTCNYCRNYRQLVSLGPAALTDRVEKFRSPDHRKPDCLVAFSGGRDSSYGLYYLKEVLGLNPLAFTYNWLDNHLANRNQERVCRQLGVEQVVITADLEKKKNNIRKNIIAWLKKPDLGMVPLFMVGDKHFFYYANRLRRERKVELVVFCENRLEKTDFKMGFCGCDTVADPAQRTCAIYLASRRNTLRLGLHFAKNFIANPTYWNSSLLDTFTGYLSGYFIPHDYLRLYEYIDWDETTVINTLKSRFGWEGNAAGETWRVGDGTAPFYNYIYYTVAGFTEHDTFLSNLVREGKLSRAEALRRVELANLPQFADLDQYLTALRLEPLSVLEQINHIPKLH